MHGPGSSLQETAGVRLYLDDSGSDDTSAAVLGGMLINYSKYHSFEDGWHDVLERRGIAAPLHMKELGKHGRLGGISPACRFELFSELAQLINDHEICSLAAKVRSERFKVSVDEELQRHFGLYVDVFCVGGCHESEASDPQ
jgi:hypothetical protein